MKFLYVVLIMFCLVVPAGAGDLVLITENAPPNSFKEDGELKGLAVDMVRAVLDEIGMSDQEIKLYPWARGYKLASHKKNTGLFATVRTPEREPLFKWAGPITNLTVAAFKLKTNEAVQAATVEELKQYKVGGVKGDAKAVYLISQGIDVELVNDEAQNIAKLLRSRIDVFAHNTLRMAWGLKSMGHDPGEVSPLFVIPELSGKSLYLAFNKETEDALVEKFQKGFDAVEKNGTKAAIHKKWE